MVDLIHCSYRLDLCAWRHEFEDLLNIDFHRIIAETGITENHTHWLASRKLLNEVFGDARIEAGS